MRKATIDVKPGELKKLNKLMKKLSAAYDKAKNAPVSRARIEKRAMKTQKRIDFILGRTDDES